jgi:hypothetical protein
VDFRQSAQRTAYSYVSEHSFGPDITRFWKLGSTRKCDSWSMDFSGQYLAF